MSQKSPNDSSLAAAFALIRPPPPLHFPSPLCPPPSLSAAFSLPFHLLLAAKIMHFENPPLGVSMYE